MSGSRHWSVREVYNQIIKTYSNQASRPMLIHKSPSNYETLGAVLFSIQGSPPKGHALYVPVHHYLIIIDAWGKTRRFQDVEVTGLDQFKDDDILERENDQHNLSPRKRRKVKP